MCGPTDAQGQPRSAPSRRLTEGRFHLRGHVLPDGAVRDVFIVDGRITFEPLAGAVTLIDGGWLLPGLVDSHAHLALASPAAADASPQEHVEASARSQLDAGVLLVREPGGPNRASSTIGPHLGLPRVQAAGRFIAPPGRYFDGLAREVTPNELATAVSEEAAGGSGWVKLVGDFPGPNRRLAMNWEADSLKLAADTAHAAGARITIHAVMPETIMAAVDAGFDGIEHGTGMPPDLVPELARHGVAWTPTMLISDGIREWVKAALADTDVTLVERWLTALPSAVAAAARAGVTLLAGTDAGMVPHGMIAAEVQALIGAGVPAVDAVAAASWEARRYLRAPCISEGAPADIVALPDDPRANPGVLTRHSVIILDGRHAVTEHDPRSAFA